MPSNKGVTNHGLDVQAVVVRRKNGLLLAEWPEYGVPRRAWVTPDMVVEDHGNLIIVRRPEEGIPYGVDFSRAPVGEVTGEDVSRELRRRGIWTVAELRARPQDAIGALQSAYGFDLARLMEWAKEFEKQMEAT